MLIDVHVKDFFSDKRVLVTGGAGFIGSHLCEMLVHLGARVTVLDNLSTGFRNNIASITDKIDFISGDITNAQTCLVATEGHDFVFHLAAQISVPESQEHPEHSFITNSYGTFCMLEAAKKNMVKKFIFSSSSAVYGPQEEPCVEEMPCNPTSMYGTSKLIGEQLCKSYSSYFQVPTVCLRYFNVYGPRQNPNGQYAGVVAKFRECMQKNQPITIFGNGMQTRDFVPVSEVVRANILLATLPTEQLVGQPINIAMGKSISLIELVQHLRKEFPEYSHEIQFAPARLGDIALSKASCKRFESLLQLAI